MSRQRTRVLLDRHYRERRKAGWLKCLLLHIAGKLTAMKPVGKATNRKQRRSKA